MIFWLRTVIHSVYLCQSGGAVEVAGGGGARREDVKDAKVTRSDRRTERRAGRRSGTDVMEKR